MKEYPRNLGTSEDANRREGRVSSGSIFVWPRFKSVGIDQRLRAEFAVSLIFMPMLGRHSVLYQSSPSKKAYLSKLIPFQWCGTQRILTSASLL